MTKGDLLQIQKKLLHKFQANEIDEIVITGMGTCHTAAVAIAAIMSNHPAIKESNIRVKAYLASELSGRTFDGCAIAICFIFFFLGFPFLKQKTMFQYLQLVFFFNLQFE